MSNSKKSDGILRPPSDFPYIVTFCNMSRCNISVKQNLKKVNFTDFIMHKTSALFISRCQSRRWILLSCTKHTKHQLCSYPDVNQEGGYYYRVQNISYVHIQMSIKKVDTIIVYKTYKTLALFISRCQSRRWILLSCTKHTQHQLCSYPDVNQEGGYYYRVQNISYVHIQMSIKKVDTIIVYKTYKTLALFISRCQSRRWILLSCTKHQLCSYPDVNQEGGYYYRVQNIQNISSVHIQMSIKKVDTIIVYKTYTTLALFISRCQSRRWILLSCTKHTKPQLCSYPDVNQEGGYYYRVQNIQNISCVHIQMSIKKVDTIIVYKTYKTLAVFISRCQSRRWILLSCTKHTQHQLCSYPDVKQEGGYYYRVQNIHNISSVHIQMSIKKVDTIIVYKTYTTLALFISRCQSRRWILLSCTKHTKHQLCSYPDVNQEGGYYYRVQNIQNISYVHIQMSIKKVDTIIVYKTYKTLAMFISRCQSRRWILLSCTKHTKHQLCSYPDVNQEGGYYYRVQNIQNISYVHIQMSIKKVDTIIVYKTYKTLAMFISRCQSRRWILLSCTKHTKHQLCSYPDVNQEGGYYYRVQNIQNISYVHIQMSIKKVDTIIVYKTYKTLAMFISRCQSRRWILLSCTKHTKHQLCSYPDVNQEGGYYYRVQNIQNISYVHIQMSIKKVDTIIVYKTYKTLAMFISRCQSRRWILLSCTKHTKHQLCSYPDVNQEGGYYYRVQNIQNISYVHIQTSIKKVDTIIVYKTYKTLAMFISRCQSRRWILLSCIKTYKTLAMFISRRQSRRWILLSCTKHTKHQLCSNPDVNQEGGYYYRVQNIQNISCVHIQMSIKKVDTIIVYKTYKTLAVFIYY